MIPGLLYQSAKAVPVGIIAAPSYEYVLAHNQGQYSAQAEGVFTINPDGSWVSRGTGYPNRSGLWRAPVLDGAGNALQVRITLTKDLTPDFYGRQIVDGIVTNPAADWVSLAEARSVSVLLQRYSPALVVAPYIARVEIRSGATIVSSGTFSYVTGVQVDQNLPSGDGPGGWRDGEIPGQVVR